MNTTTVSNHLKRFTQILRDIYSGAEVYNPTHEKLIEEINEKIYKTDKFQRCPQRIKSLVQTIDRELFKNIQNNLVVWGVWYLGEFYHDWKDYPEEIKQKVIRDPDNKVQAHFWLRLHHLNGKRGRIKGSTLTREYKITQNRF